MKRQWQKSESLTENPKIETKKKRLIFLLLTGIILVILGIVYVVKNIPNPKKLMTDEFPETSQIFDRNGKLLYEFYSDKRRVPVKLTDVSDKMIKATLAIEDVNFYKHGGFDVKGIIRGLYRTIFQKRLQGGSTLTQQLVKNALLSPERTWTRKIKEAILTIATEALYSKDQILEMYFNQTPYGGTVWGVQAAAKAIFGKEVKDLSLAEAALLAGLPGSPTAYSPFAHPDAAKNRQGLVLQRMEELKMISTEEKQNAEQENLAYNIDKTGIEAAHFVFYVKEQLVEKYGLSMVNQGGLRIKTTLDLEMQKYAEATMSAELKKLVKMKVTNGAVMITEPKTGEILTMIGSKDYFATDIDGKFNVTTALRQPGSSIKPLNYAVGIETGKITAASIYDDNPTCFLVSGQKEYCPSNYGFHYFGIQTARNALASSLNIPAVKTLWLNGLETFVASASAMGITTFKDPSKYGLSLTLGGGEVMMTDMTTAFGVLANSGIKQPLVSILSVTDRHGKILEEYQYIPGERVLSAETAFIIQQILSDDGARSMVFGRGSMLNIKGHPEVAVKTGTTNDMRDNWTIGYTPGYVVATWVGNNDNTKMGGLVSGTTGAAPIWNKIMTQVLKFQPVRKMPVPQMVVSLPVCNLTGQLVPEGGCDSHMEYFKKEFQPTKRVPLKNNVLINKDNGQLVKKGEETPNAEWQEHLAVQDITGVWICLDCPPKSEDDKSVNKIN
jgi:penicillin-binding protein 1C